MIIKIYLISVIICLSATAERLLSESNLNKQFNKELTKRDLINSFIPGVNTYYSYLLAKNLYTGIIKNF